MHSLGSLIKLLVSWFSRWLHSKHVFVRRWRHDDRPAASSGRQKSASGSRSLEYLLHFFTFSLCMSSEKQIVTSALIRFSRILKLIPLCLARLVWFDQCLGSQFKVWLLVHITISIGIPWMSLSEHATNSSELLLRTLQIGWTSVSVTGKVDYNDFPKPKKADENVFMPAGLNATWSQWEMWGRA